jgi:hypothetical protein
LLVLGILTAVLAGAIAGVAFPAIAGITQRCHVFRGLTVGLLRPE